MMYLILAEPDPSQLPTTLEEKIKLWTTQIEMVKKDLNSGELKMIGIDPGGSGGFLVSEQDPSVILAKRIMAAGSPKFTVKPMLSLEEYEAVIKGIQP